MTLIDFKGPDWALEQLDSTASAAPTLDETAAAFFAWKAGNVRSARTVEDYRRDYDNWLSPALGHKPVDRINEADVQDLIDSMRPREGYRGLSPKSIADRHAILHAIFKWAAAPQRRDYPVDRNPCIGTDLPKRTKSTPHGLKPAEVQALFSALRTINPDAADLAEFALASGWRWSECVALGTFDVEDDGVNCWVTVTRVARRQADSSTTIVQDAKSEAGKRRIKLDRGASALVRRRVAAAGPGGLVFTTVTGAMWDYQHFRARYWVKAVEAANLHRKPSFHWLRHTSVGYLAMSGKVSMDEIRRRIGHEHISTTFDVYGGMVEDVSDDALEAFAAIRSAKPVAGAELPTSTTGPLGD